MATPRISINSMDGKWETTEVLINGKKANNMDSFMLMGRKAWSYEGEDGGTVEVPAHFTFMMSSSTKKGEDEEQSARLEINNSAEVGTAFLDEVVEDAADASKASELEGTSGDGTGTTEGDPGTTTDGDGSRSEETATREAPSSEEAPKKPKGARVLGV